MSLPPQRPRRRSRILLPSTSDIIKEYRAMCSMKAGVRVDESLIAGIEASTFHVHLASYSVDGLDVILTLMNRLHSLTSIKLCMAEDTSVTSSRRRTGSKSEESALLAPRRLFKFGMALRFVMTRSPGLKRLEVSGLKFSYECAAKIAEGLANCSEITDVDFSDSQFGDRAFLAMADALKGRSSLTTLSLRNCALTVRSVGAAVAILKQHCANRDDMVWALGLRGSSDAADNDSDDLRVDFGLLAVDLSGNAFGDDIAESVGRLIARDKWLRVVRLQGTGLTSKGVQLLLDGLRTNTTLLQLDVLHNSEVDNDLIDSVRKALSGREWHVIGREAEARQVALLWTFAGVGQATPRNADTKHAGSTVRRSQRAPSIERNSGKLTGAAPSRAKSATPLLASEVRSSSRGNSSWASAAPHGIATLASHVAAKPAGSTAALENIVPIDEPMSRTAVASAPSAMQQRTTPPLPPPLPLQSYNSASFLEDARVAALEQRVRELEAALFTLHTSTAANNTSFVAGPRASSVTTAAVPGGTRKSRKPARRVSAAVAEVLAAKLSDSARIAQPLQARELNALDLSEAEMAKQLDVLLSLPATPPAAVKTKRRKPASIKAKQRRNSTGGTPAAAATRTATLAASIPAKKSTADAHNTSVKGTSRGRHMLQAWQDKGATTQPRSSLGGRVSQALRAKRS